METHGTSGVEYEKVDQSYFEQRQLKRGAAGWVLLVGLGIAYVISGDYAGWNFGLEQGGWGGLMIASLLMALMYTCMCFALAELATIARQRAVAMASRAGRLDRGAASSQARQS